MELEAKNAIVTGGVSGLGRSIVERLCLEGVRVAVFDIDRSGFESLQAQVSNVSFYPCDVTDAEQVERSVNACTEAHGTVEILINNAGILYNAPLVKLSPAGIEKHAVSSWQKVLETDLSSVFYMTVNVVEKMIRKRTRGVIINISSICAAGNAGQSAYSAAKAGVNALTVTWAKELGPFGIRVAAVAPGFFDTASTRSVLSESILSELTKEIPLKRLGKPAEAAEGVVSIIRNDYYTGGILALNGGLAL